MVVAPLLFLWNDDGMKVWFFTRSLIPSDVSTANPNPAGWGTPTAFWPSSTCDTTKFFGPQTMILEINVCGNFAVDKFNQTCSAVASQCSDVVPDPSNFDDAYFEIRYITVFSNSTTGTSTTPSSTVAGSTLPSLAPSPSANPQSAGQSLKIISPLVVMTGFIFPILAVVF